MIPASKRNIARLLSALLAAATISGAEYAVAATASPVMINSTNKVIRILGANFGPEMGFSTVTLSGSKLHVVKWTDTYIDALLPADAVSGPLLVTTARGASMAVPVSIAYTPSQQAYLDSRSVYVDAKAVASGNGTKASPFKTIGDALKNLPAASPRYVFVAPGTYKERVRITKSNVKLIGSGPNETVIDARGTGGGGPAVTLGAGGFNGGVSGVAVSGFTVTGGSVVYADAGGGGIFGDYGNSNIDINNNIIRNNGGEYGGGIWLHNSNHDVQIWSNEIYSNGNVGGYGGGISVTDEPEYETATGQPPEGSPYHHTWDDHFPGPPPGTYHVYNNAVFNNFSMDYGGGMSFYEIKDRLLIYGNLIAGNKADDHGGAIFMEDSGPAEIHSNVIARNYAADDGGAISLEDVGDDISTVQIYNNAIIENIADDRDENTAHGGAIGLDDALHVSIFNNTIAGNIVAGTAEPRGGAVGSERHGHEYINTAPGFSDSKVHNNIIWSNWRVKYDSLNPVAEALNYKMGVNYRWTPDNLFNDDPRVNSEWSNSVNSNSFSGVKSNVISGGYANGVGNVDADMLFAAASAQPWVLAPNAPNGKSATSGIAIRDVGTPGNMAPFTNAIVQGAMLNPAQVLATFYSGTGSDVFGVKLADGVTMVDLSVPDTERISNVSTSAATGAVNGIQFPYGNVSYTVTSSAGSCVPVTLHFSAALPSRTVLYSANEAGKYFEVPFSNWTQTGPSSIEVTLCDGGAQDNDKAADRQVTSTVAVGEVVNIAPVANAGADLNIFIGQGVILDGSKSYDPNGDFIMSYNWSIFSAPAGSGAVLSGATTASPSFIPDVVGDYVLSLIVNDGTTNSAADTVLVAVRQNMPPAAAIAASSTSGFSPMTVVLDGNGSTDPEGSALAYAWDFGDASSASNSASTASASHTYSVPGTYTAVLTVTDNFGNTDKASVTITVEAFNAPPTAAPAATPATGNAPLNVHLAANAIDPEGALLSYEWNFGDGSPVSIEANPAHVYTAPGSYTATVKVSDGKNTVTGSTIITVKSLLSIDVTELKLDAGDSKDKKVKGEVNLKANVAYGAALASGDTVKIVLDGMTLLQTTFGKFKADGKAFKYDKDEIVVKLDLVSGKMSISGHKLVLDKIDPKNGIDVVITLGSASASDSVKVEIEDITRKKSSYKARE